MRYSTWIRMLTIGFYMTVLAACSPLTRGFTKEAFVSTSAPAVTISSVLPTLAEGKGSAFVRSEEAMLLTPDFWTRISGSMFDRPMTVIAYAVAPDGFEWCGTSSCYADDGEIGRISFDGHQFIVTVRAAKVTSDPFAPLFFTPEELKTVATDKAWIAVRFVDPSSDQWRTKLIMEYREPLPDSISADSRLDKQSNNPEIQGVLKRAKHAFTFQYSAPKDLRPQQAQFLHVAINGKQLGAFLGMLMAKQPSLFFDK